MLKDMANSIRFLSIDMVERAKSGHPGMPMGMADVATVLFTKHLRFNPKDPKWAKRDRFVLSNGHGSALLYSILHLTGYKEFENIEQLKNFRRLGYHTAGHPEVNQDIGIETTTGPLGQGIANAVGMALAERIMNAKFGDELINNHTYVFAGDGCLMEGVANEAVSFAGHMKLSKLIVLFDDNNITIDGRTDISNSDDIPARFKACNWNVIEIDGHDFDQIDKAITKAKQSDKPTLICCKTVIGFGSPNKADSSKAHGAPLGKEEVELTRKALNWPHAEFSIPDEIYKAWQSAAQRCIAEYNGWQESLGSHPEKQEFTRRMKGNLSLSRKELEEKLSPLLSMYTEQKPEMATRKTSQFILNELFPSIPELIGGSADLTGSNCTLAEGMEVITPENNYNGNYINYGVREHAMAAIANGLSLYGGLIPYVGTFFAFSDYMRPALRLSALMNQRVIYVLTHDSIGLGEDGPTHQPIEHLASLRAMPNIRVSRPCDIIETADAWIKAIHHDGPTALILSRQNLPTISAYPISFEYDGMNGIYKTPTVSDFTSSEGIEKVEIIATGSEVSIASEVAKKLKEHNIVCKVYSLPCWEDVNLKSWSNDMDAKIFYVSIEAASTFGWERLVGCHGLKFGVDSFGDSAPAPDLYEHFGLTVDNITTKILRAIL